MSTDTIRVHCQDCGSKINAPAKMAGKVASCPKCKATLTIPHPESSPEEDDGYQFDVAPPDPPFVPPVPVFEREADGDDQDDEKPSPRATARRILGIDMGAAAFSDAWPNLTSYLILIQIAAAFVAAMVVIAGMISGLFALVIQSADVYHCMGVAILVFATHCLVAWLINMAAMAGVELVRVLLQIEANTRKGGAL